MTCKELVQQISQDTGLPQTDVSAVLRSFNTTVLKTVAEGERVTIPKFGAFYLADNPVLALFGGTRKTKREQVVRFKIARSVEV